MNLFRIIFLLLALSVESSIAQSRFRVMFYNVENLFDTDDDPHKNDNEFLPEGRRNWTYGRYKNKLNNVARVISAAGEGWETPAIVGLCEVENDRVLNDLTKYSPLGKWKYKYIVTDSPDDRGIDVALLYQPDRMRYLYHSAYRIKFPYNHRKRTRDVLHVTGLVSRRDTVDIFVCHYPSRRGGEKESEPDRMYVSSIIKTKTDSLLRIRQNANIIIMGDFNDEPSNRSISETLGAVPAGRNIERNNLYNLFSRYEKERNRGSYKYGRLWNMLDQMIVSGDMLSSEGRVVALPYTAAIFVRDYMLTEDKKNGGRRPRKTFHGYTHEGGFSDHLPIVADFEVRE